MMKIGVLALQGAFIEQEQALSALGVEAVEIRRRSQFTDGVDGIVLPGGESTAQGKLLREEGLFTPVKEAIEAGMPVFGTCAGMILLAKKLAGGEAPHFGVMDVSVRRNAYGRQLGSFRAALTVDGVGEFPAVFIRAPYVEELLSPSAKALAKFKEKVVAVRQGNMLATAFHPELTDDLRVHAYFVDIVRGRA